MPLDFPNNPVDGQVYNGFYYDGAAGVWQSNAGTQLPDIFKNVTYTTAQTYLTPLTAKGKLGQTANLQEWTDSSGNVLARIDATGNMLVQSLTSIQPMVSVPTGALMPYAGATAPDQFLLCDGSAVSRTTYATLFSAISTTYGAGNGTTTFNLPDLRGRLPMGAGTGAGEGSSGTGAPTGTALTARTRGQWGGKEAHALSEAELAVHSHTTPNHSHSFSGTTDSGGNHNHSGGDYGHTHNTYANWNTAGGGNSNTGAPGDPRGNPTETGYANIYINYGGTHSHTYSGTTGNAAPTTNNAGSGSAHTNVQPFIVTNYIIKT